jgi:hypothetical protein
MIMGAQRAGTGAQRAIISALCERGRHTVGFKF